MKLYEVEKNMNGSIEVLHTWMKLYTIYK